MLLKSICNTHTYTFFFGYTIRTHSTTSVAHKVLSDMNEITRIKESIFFSKHEFVVHWWDSDGRGCEMQMKKKKKFEPLQRVYNLQMHKARAYMCACVYLHYLNETR